MNRDQAREIVNLLLDATSNTVGDDGLADGFIVRAGCLAGVSITIFFSRRRIISAAIMLRSLGPPYLRQLPLNYSIKALRSFLRERIHLICDGNPFGNEGAPFLDRMKHEDVGLLVDEFMKCDILHPDNQAIIFPLVTVRVADDLRGSVFTFSSNPRLQDQPQFAGLPSGYINGDQYPPFASWNRQTESPASWLLVNAPSVEVAKKYRASILGAVALTVMHQYRYQFTERKVFGGIASFGSRWTVSGSSPHTPALGALIDLTSEDKDWLDILDLAIVSTDESNIKSVKALQYFYRSWFLFDSERFVIDCITLDSLFGDAKGATEAVARGVEDLFGGRIDRARVLLLMRLRSSVIHGGAPDVFDSEKYGKYYRKYGEDPISDMSSLVAECLRRKIFSGTLREQSDPYARTIADAVAAGIYPLRRPTGILSDID